MLKNIYTKLFLFFFLINGYHECISQENCKFHLSDSVVVCRINGKSYTYRFDFKLLYTSDNPKLSASQSGIYNVRYNVPVWKANGKDVLGYSKRTEDQYGDGFDDAILNKKKMNVTANIFSAAICESFMLKDIKKVGDTIKVSFIPNKYGSLSARLLLKEDYPIMSYTFIPQIEGYFSIAYLGSPSFHRDSVQEIWQPLIWQERRMPDKPYMTLAYRCPLPTTLVTHDNVTWGIVADKEEFPFNPLPTVSNSRFGVALCNPEGQMQPQIFAPVLGGKGSGMKKGDKFSFKVNLYVDEGDCSVAYEEIARTLYKFRDYRSNALGSLNRTLDNMIDYGMSTYSLFVDSLKGCNYSTDAPGAVKNVSSLNPLQISYLTGREDIFEKRAYPMIEYGLSREKFLFCLDSKQRIQYPSRLLNGPCAPISELTALYNITGRTNSFLLNLAKEEYGKNRNRNLDKIDFGNRWQNALAIYRATNEKEWLDKACKGADNYISERIETKQTKFKYKDDEFFFWTGFTPDWVNLYLLYEDTGKTKYLEAAHKAIRQYTMFVWLCPYIPDEKILVNPEGKAPYYSYLKGKGYKRMEAPREYVDAWRLSEIGLTPESSSTSTGHRGIFMANYAPWMLRIGYLTGDSFLQDIARSAIIGRYQNFPGYHINTARTTVYEKADYPYRKYDELSVNSFHFNHIWPHMNILSDYLVTDAFVKSDGCINFPAEFVEGFAYLQSRFYGFRPGRIYQYNDVNLFVPQHLFKEDTGEINYISGYNEKGFFLVLLNQSKETQNIELNFNDSLFVSPLNKEYDVEVWKQNEKSASIIMYDGKSKAEVLPGGITVLYYNGLKIKLGFRKELEHVSSSWNTDYVKDDETGVVGLALRIAENHNFVYVYVNAEDCGVEYSELQYKVNGSKWKYLVKKYYPFEFTIPLNSNDNKVEFKLKQFMKDGTVIISNNMKLHK